jgi:hypothetical protein
MYRTVSMDDGIRKNTSAIVIDPNNNKLNRLYIVVMLVSFKVCPYLNGYVESAAFGLIVAVLCHKRKYGFLYCNKLLTTKSFEVHSQGFYVN